MIRGRRLLLVLALSLSAASAFARTCPTGNPRIAPDSRFALAEPVTGQFVVTDLDTGLMWKRCREGQGGFACTGAVSTMNWSSALTAANDATFAGFDDWRLPNDIEAQSLLESGCSNPALNDTMFPNAMAATSVVWASTTSVGASAAWVTDVDDGYNYTASKSTANAVWLVRAGRGLDSFESGTGKAIGSVVFDTLSFTYDGSPKIVTAHIQEEPGTACTVTPNIGPNAGSYAVSAACDGTNFMASAGATATIAKAVGSVVFDPLETTYNGAAHAVTARIAEEPATSCVVPQSPVGPNAGAYAVSATCNGTNYTASGSAMAHIAKVASTVDFGTLAFTYDGSIKAIIAHIHDEPGTSCGVMPSTIGPDAGSTAVTATCSGTNYTASGNATANIARALSTVDFGMLVFTYDGNVKPIAAHIHDEPGTSCSVTPSSVGPNAGGTPVTAACSGTNYTASSTATATIARAASTVDFDTLSFTYDGSVKPLAAHIHHEPGTNCSVTPSSVGPNAGSTPVMAACSGTNYTASSNVTALIAKAPTTLALSSPCMTTFVEGQPYTLVATLTGGINATGTVDFDDGKTSLCGNVAFVNGMALCRETLSAYGQATTMLLLGADYSGDANHAQSQASSLTVKALGLAEALFRNGFDRQDPDACPIE